MNGVGVCLAEKGNTASLLLFLLACYAVAFTAGMMTRPEIAGWYSHLNQPGWRPPNWLFGPVWTILYGMMAVAGWKVWCAPRSLLRTATLSVFVLQLLVNFAWSPVFFNLHRIGTGFFVILALAALLLIFILLTLRVQRTAAWLFVPYLFWVSFAAALNYTIWTMNPVSTSADTTLPLAVAHRLVDKPDAQGFPTPEAWAGSTAIAFNRDWKGENPTPSRATEVRLLWTPETLFLRFRANYQSLYVYDQARNDGWKDKLWDRDVAEVFLQADASDPLKYKEFEVAPNGFWIDLDISHGTNKELSSGLQRRVVLDEKTKTWMAELAIPIHALTARFDENHSWRVNFYRVEGAAEPRFYSAWSPTFTPEPSFHVPERFGKLVFSGR